MTERKDALNALLAKVEAGDNRGFRLANRSVFSTPCQDINLQMREEHCRHAYKGSLDAAKALHEAVLHDRVTKYEVWSMRYGGSVELRDGADVFGYGTDVDGNPARAWLIAILRALISEAAL